VCKCTSLDESHSKHFFLLPPQLLLLSYTAFSLSLIYYSPGLISIGSGPLGRPPPPSITQCPMGPIILLRKSYISRILYCSFSVNNYTQYVWQLHPQLFKNSIIISSKHRLTCYTAQECLLLLIRKVVKWQKNIIYHFPVVDVSHFSKAKVMQQT
jgi:hypothetical protein